jgi:hypothetical protein
VPEIADAAAALVVEFGARDEAVADVLLGAAHAQGRLPFDCWDALSVHLPSETPSCGEIRISLWLSGTPSVMSGSSLELA